MTARTTTLAATALLLSATLGCAHTAPATPVSSSFDARRKLAHELIARGDWQPAFAYVDSMHREQPGDPELLVMRATIYREQNLLDEAETDLREATRLAPRMASARAALGLLDDLRRRPVEAEEQLRQAVKLDPENAVYLNNLGFSLFLHGKTKEAITFYEKAARLAPMTRRTRTNLGFACAAQGDWHRAAREFEMGGTPVEAKVNLGFAYERRGDLANAYDLYEEATRIDPKSKRARTNLIHVAELLGRPAPALPGTETPSDTPVVGDDGTTSPRGEERQP
ncbi:MAG TPA: tetratricopeptide repeat protein [Polyangia bacterium]|jgi:Flp pilus assembly protein TadD